MRDEKPDRVVLGSVIITAAIIIGVIATAACAAAADATTHKTQQAVLATEIYTVTMTNGDLCYVYNGNISCVAHPGQ